ncbi:hypothetical protein JCGZ_25319 [Jatropha curcas]|uniref:Uncharacterized protein n=1 Tax=Jatropha curcas TaxID=180498 RepID=A0A067JZ73_JATCU|nr:hypothetical protein JCGZ_25319 [Jatropha curcas]
MARGRAVDSDASGSGTSRASSSAQPPVPPSLPSIPSSSTPLSGPAESSLASQSPTAPAFVTSLAASSEPRNKLSLVAGHIYPSSRASRQIMRIIKLHLDKDEYIWDVIHKRQETFIRKSFQKHFIWEKAITAMLKVAWEKLCTLRYADFTYRMRKSGGSIYAIETSRLLAEKYGREPTLMEVFTYTNTKDHDGNTFVDRCALGVNPDHSAEEISALWARVDEQERQLAELRAYVMRMSGQHGAHTSSFDPPPATDRHVSTALHQPLSSPFDPDTADDTLITPADTTTHPADTPTDAMTLDRAENRPVDLISGLFNFH